MLGSYIIYQARRNHQYRLRLDAVASIARFEHKIWKSEVVCNRTRVHCLQSALHTNVLDRPDISHYSWPKSVNKMAMYQDYKNIFELNDFIACYIVYSLILDWLL